ncbi:hypothetical protein EKD16_00640 [Streptomonospora litoralis]|uniref:Uncharacterized protein n=2 Tax=Streptomonospora litoralis TaxID=2498135 RepID=A0A4P6PUX8_9ACTN|nr:hypothetical protein EKD16_00640 [Streptomonospora litoralis]
MPVFAASGTGKTTLAHSLRTFHPQHYTETVEHSGNVTFEALKTRVQHATQNFPANEDRVIPVNIDHRESNPADNAELANIKRFLREPTLGKRVLILWPETAEPLASEMARGYIEIAGRSPVAIPSEIQGPSPESWPSIATHTLEMSNSVESLELLGVNPEDYAAEEYRSLGDYLRHISDDFTNRRVRILQETRKPVRLVVVFVSESPDAGVLTQLTNSTRFGLVDGNALLDATKSSEVGRWWRDHRGLLTQMIVQLDARTFGLPPAVSIPLLRKYSSTATKDLEDLGINFPDNYSIARTISRSDIGKYLNGTVTPTFETRGTPSTVSLPAFTLLSEKGFTAARDKPLNRAILAGIETFLGSQDIESSNFQAETQLDFTPLLPDASFYLEQDAVCLEFAWRKGDFLTPKNRADISVYILTKLRNYARELGHIQNFD